jgi:hypothetical protein
MKANTIFLMIFSLALISSGVAYAQESAGPGIVFDTLFYDFKILKRGSDAECSFTFTNCEKKPVLITRVKASCGCTVPQWPREPVAPADTGVIRVKYNTRSTGRFSKSILVYTNLDRQAIVLTVKGEVRRKVAE